MKRSLFHLLSVAAFLSLILSPACSTTEEQAIVYDITGSWQFAIDFGGSWTDQETFIFSGSITNGVTNNVTDGTNGIYAVNNTAVDILLSYFDPMCWDVTENFTGSFTSPTTISGNVYYSATGMCIGVANVTFTATKL